MRIVPITDVLALREVGVFYKPETLRKLYSNKIHPQLFTKVLGRLYVIEDEWLRLVQKETARFRSQQIQEEIND